MDCRFKEKRDWGLALGLLYLENYIKRPGCGWGAAGIPLEGRKQHFVPPGLAHPGRALGGRPGVAPSAGVRESPWPPPAATETGASVTTHPSGPPPRQSGGYSCRPAPLRGRASRTRSPWPETSPPPSDRVPAPPRARTSSPDHLGLRRWGTPRQGEMGKETGWGRDERRELRQRRGNTRPPPSSPSTGKRELGGRERECRLIPRNTQPQPHAHSDTPLSPGTRPHDTVPHAPATP